MTDDTKKSPWQGYIDGNDSWIESSYEAKQEADKQRAERKAESDGEDDKTTNDDSNTTAWERYVNGTGSWGAASVEGRIDADEQRAKAKFKIKKAYAKAKAEAEADAAAEAEAEAEAEAKAEAEKRASFLAGIKNDYLEPDTSSDGSVQLAREVRSLRNKMLFGTDWTATSDRTMSTKMTTYRQALRDVPQQDGFPNVINWPT